jgi:transcriptional regulator with XRE-family HTH domain
MSSISTAAKIEQLEPKQLAKNLLLLLKRRNLSENDLAKALNIPTITIKRLTSGEITNPKIDTLILIANHLNVSIDALVEKTDEATLGLLRKKPRFIPILDWSTAASIESIKKLDLQTWAEWQPIALDEYHEISKLAFALQSKPSMNPTFPTGTVFIIDPDTKPTDGDMVLVKIKDDNELSLRKLVIDPPEWKLISTIPGLQSISYSKQKHVIIGVVELTLLHRKK